MGEGQSEQFIAYRASQMVDERVKLWNDRSHEQVEKVKDWDKGSSEDGEIPEGGSSPRDELVERRLTGSEEKRTRYKCRNILSQIDENARDKTIFLKKPKIFADGMQSTQKWSDEANLTKKVSKSKIPCGMS